MHVGISDELPEMPQQRDGLRCLAVDESARE